MSLQKTTIGRIDFMYKIEFIPTGHTFELPSEAAEELKQKFPDEYRILEKNGKKYFTCPDVAWIKIGSLFSELSDEKNKYYNSKEDYY